MFYCFQLNNYQINALPNNPFLFQFLKSYIFFNKSLCTAVYINSSSLNENQLATLQQKYDCKTCTLPPMETKMANWN